MRSDAGLYTVEFKERHAGQTADGVQGGWYEKIEPFRVGIFDDARKRALDRRHQLLAEPDKYHLVRVTAWNVVFDDAVPGEAVIL